MGSGSSSQLQNMMSPIPGQNPLINIPGMPSMGSKGGSSGGGGSAPQATQVAPVSRPSMAAPITSQSAAPQGSITSALGNSSISPQILALLQKLRGSGG